MIERGAEYMDVEFGSTRSAYEFVYHQFDRTPYDPAFSRFRYTQFHGDDIIDGKLYTSKERRYDQRAGTGVRAYFPLTVDWLAVLADVSIPILITEGEKKAAKACKEGFITVGLGGVNNIRRDGVFLEELAQLAAGGRLIYIAFDSDKLKKDKHGRQGIRQAEIVLATELRSAGARVITIKLDPIDGEKAGLDDVLVQKGGRRILQAAIEAGTEHRLRDTVLGIREHYSKNEVRHRLIAESIVGDLRHHGRFIHTPESRLYFDGESKTLVAFDETGSRITRAYLDAKTAVNGADIEYPMTFERLANTAENEGERTKVHKLSAWHAERSTLYIAKSESQLFEITPTGWRVVDNGAGATAECAGTLVHTRGKLAAVEVDPKRQGRAVFDALINTPNFIDGVRVTAKQSRMLWSLYCLAVFFPQALPTRPIPLFHGPKGSGKTYGYRALLRSIYGPAADVTIIDPKKPGTIESMLVHDGIAAVDNLDGSHPEMQNALATAATGGTLSMRMLYTTMQQATYPIDCFLGVTSRDPKTLSRDDVVDRALYLLVGRREAGFMEEHELVAMINAGRPKFWRWLLDTLPAVITALKAAKRGGMHASRMADFAGFAVAVGPVLGYSADAVREALAAMGAEALQFQMEYSPIVGAIGTYIDMEAGKLAWEMHRHDGITEAKYNAKRAELLKPLTAAELLSAIKMRSPDFPYKDALSFGRAVVADAAAINTRYKLTLGMSRTKTRTYTVEPLGGYLTWADALEAKKGG